MQQPATHAEDFWQLLFPNTTSGNYGPQAICNLSVSVLSLNFSPLFFCFCQIPSQLFVFSFSHTHTSVISCISLFPTYSPITIFFTLLQNY